MLSLAIATGLAACAAESVPPAAAEAACQLAVAEWRRIATAADRERLRDWREAFAEGLEQARAEHGEEVARHGALLDPDAALTEPLPPPGDYDCRTIKLGSPDGDLLSYVAYPAFHCRITAETGRIGFVKLSGSQRPIGRIYADEGRRAVFLGTLQLGDERRSYQYGIDRERDLIAAVERIGERRWRLVFPYPHFESLVDVIELTPRQAR